MIRITGLVSITVGFALLGGDAIASQDLRERAKQTFDVVPETVAQVGENHVTPEKVELGKMLFFEPRLSSSHLISCNTCHNVGLGGDDNLPTSIGHGWQKGPRNSPTVFNAFLQCCPVLGRPCQRSG
jgi:cytochrome c peroxidase